LSLNLSQRRVRERREAGRGRDIPQLQSHGQRGCICSLVAVVPVVAVVSVAAAGRQVEVLSCSGV
jgi:hypothetical protein